MNYLLQDIERIPWSELRASAGRTAANVPGAVLALWAATTEEEARAAYWRLDNVVVVQGRVFEAAEFVIPFVLQIPFDASPAARHRALELLTQVTAGWTDPDEIARGNADLIERCRQRAREGLALVYSLLDAHETRVRANACELLGVIETDSERLVSVLRRLLDNELDPDVRGLAQALVDDHAS